MAVPQENNSIPILWALTGKKLSQATHTISRYGKLVPIDSLMYGDIFSQLKENRWEYPYLSQSWIWRDLHRMGIKVKKIMKQQLKFWICCIQFKMIFVVLFGNGHFHNVVSTFIDVVKLNIETLSNIVHINVYLFHIDFS